MKYLPKLGRLELAAFVSGFGLMAYELAAARILAPTIGSSTYVWTSVIGVIIAALSIGYYVGGMVADKRGYRHDISILLLLITLMVTVTLLLYPAVLDMIASWSQVDVRLQAISAATLLFAPASFLLGMLSPYLVKLNVQSLASSGRSVASLSALNSIGVIVGTFATGFILFGYIGSRETIALVAVLLLMTSWLFGGRYRVKSRIIVSIVLAALILTPLAPAPKNSAIMDSKPVSIDTASAHYTISDFFYGIDFVRGLQTGPGGIQSAVSLSGSSRPVFWYTNELAALTLKQSPQKVLVLGGGTFTLPRYLADKLPNAKIDVVEIDPELKDIAKKYFYYDSPSNVNLIFSDARTYVNQSKSTYDVIIADVYGDSYIPFSLMTKEYGEAIAKLLDPNGVVLANIVGGTAGPCRTVFDSVSAAYLTDLDNGWYKMNSGTSRARGNMIAVYTNRDDLKYGEKISNDGQLYNDNYSPSERLYYSCQNQ